jgi:pyruvate formate lyase activating enzyme
VQPLTTIDYPDQLAMVVFCQGCPWRCRYCHNPELLPSKGATQIPWQEVERYLSKRRGLLDAVVFSGGEPTLQARELAVALWRTRALGFKCALHTAGCYPQRLAELLPLLDWVGLDIKTVMDRYASITRVATSGQSAWRSLELLLASPVEHEIRITVHPVLVAEETLARLLERLQTAGAKQVVLQACETRKLFDPTLAAGVQGLQALLQDVQRCYPWVKLRLG